MSAPPGGAPVRAAPDPGEAAAEEGVGTLQAGNPVLVAEIQHAIRESGPVTFASFMQEALYHPEHGYYARPGMTTGASGDYYTSSDLTPAFGRLLTRQIVEIAERTAE